MNILQFKNIFTTWRNGGGMDKKNFYTSLTLQGEEAFARAAVTGEPVGFSTMGVGDGAGREQSGLINERYRAPLNRLDIADQGKNVIRAEMIIPPQVGGFWMREAALFDEDGICLAVANLPESYKPLLSEGSGRLQSVNLWIAVSRTADVKLITDPSVIIASVEEVNRAKADAKDYADEVASELEKGLQKDIKDAVAQALKDAWEEENPPGTVRFFNQYINPNERWPHSRWVYTGENHSIRVGAADGSNVGASGGSDTAIIGRENLPAVQIGISGSAGDTDLGRAETSRAGAFKPVSDTRFNKLSAAASDIDGNYSAGDSDDRNPTIEYRVGNMTPDLWAAATIRDIPDHYHEVQLGTHGHNVSGKTDVLGSGKAVSIVETHILLMCWARVA